ncbi:MAG TPA: hypothetical protein VH369_02520 [Bryobacteraceae bacterium]
MRRRGTLALGFVVITLLFGIPQAFAQLDGLKNTTPVERASLQTELMKSMLALKPEQTQTVADLNLKYANRMEPIIKGSSSSLTKMFETRKINNEKEIELKGILSSQQWEKFDASRDEMRQQFEDRIGKRAGAK